jgi:hypothetical protein
VTWHLIDLLGVVISGDQSGIGPAVLEFLKLEAHDAESAFGTGTQGPRHRFGLGRLGKSD